MPRFPRPGPGRGEQPKTGAIFRSKFMHSFFKNNILLILRLAFFGGMLVSSFVLVFGLNAMQIGLIFGCFCLALVGTTKLFLVCAKNKMAYWVHGNWDDLSSSDFERIPVGLKIIFLLQHGSVVLIFAVSGWFFALIVLDFLRFL